MPKSKHRKDHKKKIKSRKEKELVEKRKIERIKREMFSQIQSEMASGKFDDGNINIDTDINIDDIDLELG